MKTLTLSLATIALAPILKIQSAFADLVKSDDPLAKALAYVNNAKDSMDRKDKKAQCINCQFYQGDTKSKSGKCQLIPTGDVAATGWCRSYSVKQKKA